MKNTKQAAPKEALRAADSLIVDFDTRKWHTRQDVEAGRLAWANLIDSAFALREAKWKELRSASELTLPTLDAAIDEMEKEGLPCPATKRIVKSLRTALAATEE